MITEKLANDLILESYLKSKKYDDSFSYYFRIGQIESLLLVVGHFKCGQKYPIREVVDKRNYLFFKSRRKETFGEMISREAESYLSSINNKENQIEYFKK